jgi:hypothetical protein
LQNRAKAWMAGTKPGHDDFLGVFAKKSWLAYAVSIR